MGIRSSAKTHKYWTENNGLEISPNPKITNNWTTNHTDCFSPNFFQNYYWIQTSLTFLLTLGPLPSLLPLGVRINIRMNIIIVKSANMTQLFCRRNTLISWFKVKHLLGTKSFIFCTISVSISSRRCILSCILKQSKRCMKKEWLEFPAKYTWWACKYDCCLIFSPFNCGVLSQAKWMVHRVKHFVNEKELRI